MATFNIDGVEVEVSPSKPDFNLKKAFSTCVASNANGEKQKSR